MAFHFAWVDAGQTSFSSAFAREDEQVLSFELAQEEGDFASLRLEVRNPRVGLLSINRKRWGWLAERTNVYDTWDGGGGVSGPSNMHILDETGRRTHVVRVYNPNNQNIWVDVEVIDSLEMVGMSGIYMWNFSNPS